MFLRGGIAQSLREIDHLTCFGSPCIATQVLRRRRYIEFKQLYTLMPCLQQLRAVCLLSHDKCAQAYQKES